MLFHAQEFLLGFLPACLAGFFLLGRAAGAGWALSWLVAASFFFYGWWNPIYLPLLWGSILGNWLIGRRIAALAGDGRAAAAHLWLLGGVAANLLLLGWFKYAGFAWTILAPSSIPPDIVLPLAISFFTFQQIMFLADSRIMAAAAPPLQAGEDQAVRPNHHAPPPVAGTGWGEGIDGPPPPSRLPQGEGEFVGAGRSSPPNLLPPGQNARKAACPPLLPYAAFVAFFPHLIAGPLVRPHEVVPQLRAPSLARPDADNLTAGLTIFLLGLAKKLVFADLFGHFADVGFDAAANGASLTFFEAWYALLAYALQIYFDFSGYSDMAIGLARMMNVRFPLNFNSPYQARDISQFWRRWHITLGAFLRDFVYIPIGGSRFGMIRRLTALAATMLLCGLWHGAAWRFVIWGGVHGLYLAVHTVYRRFLPPLPGPLAWTLTLLAVVLAWVPFRAADLPTAWAYLQALAGVNGIALPRIIVDAVPGLSAWVTAVPVLPWLGDARTLSFPEATACLLIGWTIVLSLPHLHEWTDRWRVRAVAGGFAFTAQAVFFAPHVAPFLYFRF